MGVVSGVGSVVAGVGVLGLVVGALAFLIAWHRDALARALSTTAVVSCAELTVAEDPPRRAIVVGRTGPAPSGPLRAPISGQECVWYRVVVRASRHHAVCRSSERFTVTDSTGTVQVAARLADEYLFEDDLCQDLPIALVEITDLALGSHPEARDRLRQHGFHLSGHRKDVCYIAEYRIPANQAITVLGRPRRDRSGTALATSWGICGVAAQPLDELRAGARHHANDSHENSHWVIRAGVALLAAGLAIQVLVWLAG